MSTKFFQSVRRNQKQWMVVVTVLSMVSFLFLDDFGRGQGPMSAIGGALMIGSLCAAGMCIVGYPRGQTVEYGIGGFLVGFLAGFIGFGSMGGARPVVRTSVGNISRTEINDLSRDRGKLNNFIGLVARKAQNPSASTFGSIDDASIVMYRLRLAEAKKMGIQITDERVNEFLKDLTRSNLTEKEFQESLREARLGDTELFQLLKSELSAQLVGELTEPPGYVPPLPPFIAQNLHRFNDSIRYMQETPEQLWEIFQKLHVKEKIEAVPIPVKDFVFKVSDPSEGDLVAFFDKYKGTPWHDEARPGFLQLGRVKIAYLTGNFESVEKGEEPTDAEVQEYYDKHKEEYRMPLARPSTAPKMPDESEDSPNKDAKDDQKPDSSKDDPAKDTKEDAQKPDGDEKPKDEKPKESDEKPSDKEQEKPKQDQNSGSDEQSINENQEKLELAQAAKDADANADKPAEKNDADASPEKSKADDTEAPADAGDPTNTGTGLKPPALSTTPDALPAPKYRELNDDLKMDIRDTIMRDRTFARIAIEVDKAYDAMDALRLDYDSLTDTKKKEEMAKTIANKLLAYAIEHKLEYKETPEWTYEEFQDQLVGNALDIRDRTTVANEVFSPGPRGEARLPLYAPRRADSRAKREAYAYWKIAEHSARIPDLKDEGVREKVLSAWRFDQARSLAEQRAKELAEKVVAAKFDLPVAMKEESVTGSKSDPAVTIKETEDFTWMTTNQSFPGSGRGPMISTIPLLNDIGDDFMKKVFEEIGDGEVGVASDFPKATFYVVKVVKRDLPKDDAVALAEFHDQFMKEQFTSQFFPLDKTPYQAMAQFPQMQIDQAWARRSEQQYHLVWEEETSPRPRENPARARR